MKRHDLDRLDLPEEQGIGETLVEIVGYRRVLVEHHQGVIQYSTDMISIKVKYGTISVCGRNLELTRMNCDQVIISGCIHSIMLQGGGSNEYL